MTELDDLSPETLQVLDRYGFDRARFNTLRQQVADGTLTLESNTVTGRVQAPESHAWAELPRPSSDEGKAALEVGKKAIANGEVGVVILNGGMATRFGGVVKGIVEALPGRSFLSLKLQNVMNEARDAGGRIQVFLMNSFATDESTRQHLDENRNFLVPDDDLSLFTQGISLRLTPEGEIFLHDDGAPSCYGPGHGDCPTYLRSSGCLARFRNSGGKHLLLSNVDNLAARLDPLLIGLHVLSKCELTAEVAPKWPGDAGGAPALVDGKVWVIEGFRFPADFDQEQIPVFNTNTFTVNADALTKDYELTPCYVRKTVEGRDAVQFETLVGELTRFLSSQYAKVNRAGKSSRFFPIKTPQDLADGQEDLRLICG